MGIFSSFIILLFPIFFWDKQKHDNAYGMWLLLRVGVNLLSRCNGFTKIFSKDKVGLANGIYGMGNIGTAISSFVHLFLLV